MKVVSHPPHACRCWHQKTGPAGTFFLSDNTNAEITPDGTAYEVELLNGHQQLRPKD